MAKKPKDTFDASNYMIGKCGRVVENTNPPIIPVASQSNNELPTQYTMEEWINYQKTGNVNSFSTAPPTCYHDWKLCQGLNFDDYHCTKCGETKPLNPAR